MRTADWIRCLFLMMGLAMVGPARGQEEMPDAIRTNETSGKAVVRPPALEGRYSGWVRHVGRPEEAVVHVRVKARDASGRQVARTGCGFVLRCDGFVLIPESLAPKRDTAFQASIVPASVDGEVPTAPLEAVGPPRFHGRKTDYVILKVNDHHLPCLPLLNPRNALPGMSVRLFWSVAHEGEPGKADVRRAVAIVGAAETETARFTLTLPGPPHEETEADMPPPGAVVTDPGSGAALGIVTQSGADGSRLLFSSWRYFHYVSNDVGLCFSPETAPKPGAPVGADAGDMVLIPGGPFVLSGELLGEYGKYYRTTVACLPPFYIDRLPVTVGAYRSYLRRFPAPRRPFGWDRPDELKVDYRRSDLPATGALAEDAARFAEYLGRRLPTPVEWAKAASGADLGWYREMVQEAVATANILRDLQDGKNQRYTDLYQQTVRAAADTGTVPDVEFWVQGDPALDQIHGDQIAVQRRYFVKHWFPDQAAPVGFYEEDRSIYAVCDVVTNVPEIVQTNYAWRLAEVAQKPFPVRGDPYLSRLHRWDSYAVLDPTAMRDMDGVFATFSGIEGRRSLVSYFEGRGTTRHFMNWRIDGRPGFRCAR